jgi:hypothetical protein
LSLQLSEKFSLPKDAVLWAFAFLAIRGAGKTYDAAKLAEQMLKLGFPVVVFDPMGIWWGLRVGVNGHEGFPVVIIGGQHQDLAIPLQAAKKGFSIVNEDKLREMVNGILQAGLSVVVDTSNLSSRTQQTRTVAIFADELFKKNARFGIRHVFIEEADVYAPQKPMGETQASHTAVDNLIRRGGNFNLGCTIISQRSAVIDKNVLSQANCLIALRILYVRDKDAIRDWVKNAVKNEAEMKRLAKWYDSLKKLKNGEAWIYSPEHNDLFEKIQFGERETLHASREYFLQETWEQKNITLRDVTAFVKAYKAKVEPKPVVVSPKPLVANALSAKDSAVSVIKHETVEEKTSGEAIGTASERPEVIARETTGQAERENRPEGTALGEVEMHVPSRQTEASQVQLPDRGSVEGTSRIQFDPALGEAPRSIDILRSNPVIQTVRSLVSVTVPSDVDHPKTALGKIAVVMKDDSKHSHDWTLKRVRTHFEKREWPTDGLEDAFAQMISWSILRIQSNKAYTFYPSRVEITEKTVNVIAP